MKQTIALTFLLALSTAQAHAQKPYYGIEGTSEHLSILSTKIMPPGTLYEFNCLNELNQYDSQYFYLGNTEQMPDKVCNINPEQDYQHVCDHGEIIRHLGATTWSDLCYSDYEYPVELATHGIYSEYDTYDSNCLEALEGGHGFKIRSESCRLK